MTLIMIRITGSLVLFLFGMRFMTLSIRRITGEKLNDMINTFNKNRFTSVLAGLIITAAIQSSSITTVMLMNLVNMKLLTVIQSIGIIMGANIGTTITGWLIAVLGFSAHALQIPFFFLTLAFFLYFHKNEKYHDVGLLLFGFAMLFIGVAFLKNDVPHLSHFIGKKPLNIFFLQNHYGNIFVSIAAGIAVSMLFQSSTAALMLIMLLCYKSWINYPCAAAMILGSNLGTTLTTLLASFNLSEKAQRCAQSHFIFNLLGILWIIPFFFPFIKASDYIIPGEIPNFTQNLSLEAINKQKNLYRNIPIHLAFFHTSFNMINTLVLIWFIPAISRFSEKVSTLFHFHKKKKFSYSIYSTIPDLADITLININQSVYECSAEIHKTVLLFMNSISNSKKVIAEIEIQISTHTNYIKKKITEIEKMIVQTATTSLNQKEASMLFDNKMLLYEFERILHSITKLTNVMKKQAKGKYSFDESMYNHIRELTAFVLDFINYNNEYLKVRGEENPDIKTAEEMETNINSIEKKLQKTTQKYIKKGADVKSEFLFMEIIEHLEHMGDYSIKISEILAKA